MHSQFFGARDRQLYGAYHAAHGYSTTVAVICPPWGHEYLEGHYTMRRLADVLSESGIHALRFDYFGTGDSAGSGQETTFESMTEDAETAMDEAVAMSGATECFAIGMRLGANVALGAAERFPDASGVVLWDPIFDGAQCLRELTGRERPASDGTLDIGGFAMSSSMAEELEKIAPLDLPSAPGLSLCHVFLDRGDRAQQLRDAGWSAEVYSETMPWGGHSDFGSVAVPATTLHAITEVVRGG